MAAVPSVYLMFTMHLRLLFSPLALHTAVPILAVLLPPILFIPLDFCYGRPRVENTYVPRFSKHVSNFRVRLHVQPFPPPDPFLFLFFT